MKITANQYAKTLFDLTRGKKNEEVDSVMTKFVAILGKNGQLRFKKDIIEKYSDFYNKEHGIVEAEIISYEELNSQLTDKLTGFLKDKYGAKEVVIKNRADKNIKGGIIIRIRDEVLNGSVAKILSDLRNSLEK